MKKKPAKVTKFKITPAGRAAALKLLGKASPPPPPPPKLSPALAAIMAKHGVKTVLPPPPPPTKKHLHPSAASLGQHLASHIEFTSPDGSSVIVVGIDAYKDFATIPGKLRYGYTRYNGDEFVPADKAPEDAIVAPPPPVQRLLKGVPPPPPGAKVAPKPPRAPKAPGAGKREGVCSFIDGLIMEGKYSVATILAQVREKFPGRDPQATTSTIKTRPSHIKAKGLTPPPFRA